MFCSSQSSPTPERYTRINRVQGERVKKSKAFEQTGSPSSCGGYQNSSGNSISSSSIHLRCRASRLSQFSSNNNLLDLYIDGEHHATESMTNSQRYAEIGDDEHIAESMRPTSSGRPPRYLCTAPSSPRYGTDNLRSYSFREIRGKYPKYASSHKHTENNLDSMTCEFPGKLSMSDIRGFDGETTTTIEDIYQDSSDGCPTLSSNGITKDFSLKVIPLSKGFDSHQTDQNFDVSKKACFPDRFYWASVHGELVGSTMKEQHTDEWLLKKVEELDKTYHLFEKDPEPEKLEHDRLNITTLLKNIRKITEDKRHLASELSLQIISRLKERSFAKEQLSQLKLELDTRTRRLEKEKNELQSSLEKELDRRSMEWSLKLSKFQSEEQRLRDRVRELAQQNVALQREVSSFKGIEPEMRNSITNLERQLNDCRTNQDELKAENYNLRQASMELQESCNKAEEERNYITNICKEKERESKDLQKVVVRLQRTCSEQEKTIEELGQSFSNEIGKPFIIGDNVVNQPQAEKLRLASVELNLRREVETCRIELESLRKENICLLERFRCAAGNRYGFSLARLDLELHARVECLEMQSLSLLDDSSNFCNQLLDCAGRCRLECCCMESNASAHVYSAIEPSLRHQKLRKAIENYRRSLQMISTTLDEKLGLATEASSSVQQKVQKTEVLLYLWLNEGLYIASGRWQFCTKNCSKTVKLIFISFLMLKPTNSSFVLCLILKDQTELNFIMEGWICICS
ncbi:hypothetical protein AXF42_Ash008801 [Apostasia shenzhenica]|uniref:DUF7653 domain-containing protein n=1 Tax=Apostasia shenzhenica TaxID=1088818 RepID=A0A2I0ASH5_9ASPA|nr:hypothetical protein AXF42_Ash008801 [Apostasia shenzhenica]